MESKPSWLSLTTPPRTTSLQSSSSISSSLPLGSRHLYGRSRMLGCDRYARGPSFKLDSLPESPRLHNPSSDGSANEGRYPLYGSSSASFGVSSRDRSWGESATASRSKQLHYQGDSERRLGTYPGPLTAAQDKDPKRPKLSYGNRQSRSNISSSVVGSTYTRADGVTGPSWNSWSPVSRAVASSEDLWSCQELEKRAECTASSYRRSSHGVEMDPEHVASTYAQGARPKEKVSSQVTGSNVLPVPSDYQPSWLSRNPLRNTSRIFSSASTRAHVPSAFAPNLTPPTQPLHSQGWSSGQSERSSSLLPRPPLTQSPEDSDSEGHRSTRPLLSRLANSVSLFSRRSAQDSTSSSNSTLGSPESSEIGESGRGSPGLSERRGSASSQGFSFLNRRRQGLPPVPVVPSSGLNQPSSGAADSWLSSSLRGRCAPVIPRRRREGRDETARLALSESDENQNLPLMRTEFSGVKYAEGEEEVEESQGAGATGISAQRRPHAARDSSLSGITSSLLHLSMPTSLDRSVPGRTVIAISNIAARRTSTEDLKDKAPSSRDPERLRKIQESLLLEQSDEEEGDLCRICQMGADSPSNPLIAPCRCTGSLQYVHQDCMKRWLNAKISSGSNLEAVTSCEMCKEKLELDIEGFDVNELYKTHERSEYEFISCGLYLVVLLHLWEQRFSDMLGSSSDAGAHLGSLMKTWYRKTGQLLTSVIWMMMMMKTKGN
ncbi:E3 ubiquitin-protein ligase MARCH7-like isoform X2 [Scleropages formosus]|uniref:RING-type E3 ubiquitin transferase n=1 Tax=Scleropages formosus TaxID=113540 RepID=A0A8C9SNC7_SCLFO|nr:E3 ubiquitin-protein ligase MARCH7-like isoform X2 [Scleropages formosus]